MNIVVAKRGRAKGCLTRSLEFAESINANTSLDLLEIRLLKLDETWSEFRSLEDEYYEFADEDGYEDSDPQFAEYEAKYFKAHSAISNAIRARNSSKPVLVVTEEPSISVPSVAQSESRNNSQSVHLPKISIPTFSGDYKDWPAFRDLFMGTVDSNVSLTCTQKFHYLKSFLRGDAATLVKHISCSELNYIEAWDKLERRYDQKHLIVQSFIQSFLSLPSCTTLNLQLLRKIADGADEAIRGLNALGSTKKDPWLIYVLVQKLDHETRQAWAEEIGSRDDGTILEFLEFLQTRCSCLEACYSYSRPNQIRSKTVSAVRSHLVESREGCTKCKGDHNLPQCKDFIDLTVEARRDFVKNNSLCFNCLRHGHASSKCRSQFHCRSCKARHHSLVHPVQNQTFHQLIETNSDPNSSPASSLSLHNPEPQILTNHTLESNRHFSSILPTAVARIQDNQGNFHNLRVLLDSGSQVSFVTERVVQGLGLTRKRSRIPIVGIASTSAGVTNGLVTLNLFSRYNSDSLNIDCFVLPNITSSLPPFSIKRIPTNFSSHELADPNYYSPGPIDVLIGADKVFGIIKGAASSDTETNFTSILTIFGWVISGRGSHLSNGNAELNTFCTHLDYSQEFDLERFWKLEEVSNDFPLSLEEQLAEENFAKTYSYHTALQRFYSIEKRLKFNNDLKVQYSAFINEYLSLGHMEEIPACEIFKPTPTYYLPHHAVLKSESSTTKIRVVFDASARSNCSLSLNESLLVGPTIQRDIFSICLRYRRHLYVMSGDIEKMYRQVWIARKHIDFQRIVWRQNPEDPLRHYRLLTVTYGTSAAPFLAIRTLKQLALDTTTTHPLASTILLNDFYVDDVVTGADTIDELITLQKDLVEVLKSGGFHLRKWTTNCWPLLMSIPEDQREVSPVDFEESNSVKILGLQWCPSKDCFSYRVNFSGPNVFTKRRVLSDASRIFDPLGFLSPVIIVVKILFQELWKRKLKWDDEIPGELAHQWAVIRDELHIIQSVFVPRLMITNKCNWEFHGFSDASLDAYAAVVYCRSIDMDGNISVRLVAAKTRVAPLKVLSLPRLELCGAVLLTRLMKKIRLSLQDTKVNIIAWTDSAIVLHWLSAPPKKWSVFIANRTSEILNTIPFKCWNHVRSASNPADVATRGISPSKLSSTDLWWKGPHWLSEERSQWPMSAYNKEDIRRDELEERKVVSTQVFLSNMCSSSVLEMILQNSSTWLKSLRVLAHLLRFISNCRSSADSRNYNPLSSDEINISKTKLIICAQRSVFSNELDRLQGGSTLPSKNRLLTLSPYIDSAGVLRVGGRLQQSELSYSEKHPIILCKSHPISYLIAQHMHKKHLHSGVSLTFALIRRQYYILGCRNLLRKVVHSCVKCFRLRSTTTKQLMANLPAERIRYSRPFSKVGCDYAGPFTLRLNRGRNPRFVKSYIALFVCFVTKAIHVELVGDLSSVAFLHALDRFVARRGKPYEIWSDNGTNFHGAKRLLNEMHSLLCDQQHNSIIIDHLSKDNIIWKFIPPSAPHFGGLWEAGVKSVKLHLKRVIGDTILTYEEMYTLLVKIEALLNSRPMWQTSDADQTALSPSHFLIGESYTAVPQPSVSNNNVSINTNWTLLQAMLQGFWSRWHREYLTSLQQRPKWKTPQPNLKIDDVVLVKEPNLPPSKWILGRITKIHLGSDNKCRVVTIRTKFGEFLRPAVKVAPLPIAERPLMP